MSPGLQRSQDGGTTEEEGGSNEGEGQREEQSSTFALASAWSRHFDYFFFVKIIKMKIKNSTCIDNTTNPRILCWYICVNQDSTSD